MKIIAVDDEELALRSLEKALHQATEFSEIVCFSTAADALSYAAGNQIDAAFLDIEISGCNGIQLAKDLKDILPDIHIIFVTGYSQYAVNAFAIHATGYLMKPVLKEDIERELTFIYKDNHLNEEKKVTVQTFGGFNVFVNKKPLIFKRAKAKELLAYLIDKKGAGITTREACAVLWEDAVYTPAQKSYYQTIAAELKNTLLKAGAEDILVKRRNYIAIQPERIDCDSYRFQEGDPAAINAYHGSYLPFYSWAEYSMWNFENRNSY